jgi:hypothetical protein
MRPLGECFEFNAARFIKAVRSIDQADDAVLDEVTNINRMRHRGSHSSCERLHKGKTSNNSTALGGGH